YFSFYAHRIQRANLNHWFWFRLSCSGGFILINQDNSAVNITSNCSFFNFLFIRLFFKFRLFNFCLFLSFLKFHIFLFWVCFFILLFLIFIRRIFFCCPCCIF